MSRWGRWKISGPRLVARLPRWLLLLAAATLAGLLGLGLLVQMDLTVSLEGKTRPENWHEVRAGKEGTIAKVYVETGEWVDSGTVLAELFNVPEKDAVTMAERRLAALRAERDRIAAELRLTEARYRSDLAISDALIQERRAELTQVEVGVHPDAIRSAEESVRQARIRLRDAEEDLRRGEVLFESGAIAPAELDRRRSAHEEARVSLAIAEAHLSELRTQYRPHDLDRSRARLRSAEAERAGAAAGRHAVALQRAELRRAEEAVAEAEAALAIARSELERTYLRAPAAGRVLTGDLDQLPGQGVFPGRAVLSVGDPDTIVVRARLPESKAADVKEGLPAKVFLTAYPHARYRVFEGEVLSISPYFQTIDWESLGIPREEITPEMREAFTTAVVRLADSYIEDERGTRRMLAPGLSARVDVLLDQGPVLAVLLRYLRKGYRNVPNLNFHL